MNILLVDSYDSYTYNLYQLLLDVAPDANIVILRNDHYSTEQDLGKILIRFDFVVIGPGPGDPRNPKDIGFLASLFDYKVPILGVCLGFQIMCMHSGGKIDRLGVPKHGQISPLELAANTQVFEGVAVPMKVTRYHSLCATLPKASSTNRLQEIAWALDEDNGRVVMAVQHLDEPWVGVQFHPESICSSDGPTLIRNFIKLANAYNKSNTERGIRNIEPLGDMKIASVVPRPLLANNAVIRPDPQYKVLFDKLPFALSTKEVMEIVNVDAWLKEQRRFIVLDSAAAPSRYSILGRADLDDDSYLSYYVGDDFYVAGKNEHALNGQSIWEAIAELMAERRCTIGSSGSPFWGGLAGYISYEAGVETLDVPTIMRGKAADINLVMIKHSVVVDHIDKVTYVQSVVPASQAEDMYIPWVVKLLKENQPCLTNEVNLEQRHRPTTVTLPNKEEYIAKVKQCQEYLAEGQSYELCLTALTHIQCKSKDPLDLYLQLRQNNPAPYAALISLPGVDLISSSPERFLSWTRDGRCELRPIKGTIRKSNGLTLEEATRELNNPKDYAENLMIVDLIRHDLHQIAKNVSVPSLMQVEEYKSVYQLVSVIQGQVGPSVSAPGEQSFTGLDVLAHALPPGSMTGAPKKRSVELLQTIEGHNRGIYSGVCGYFSVCGGGDWSVIIRTAFRHRSESRNRDGCIHEDWWVGAGGAITALSDPEAEWEEMLTKAQTTLPSFGNNVEIKQKGKRR
ncbi:ADC synthase [Protomyces lactucae-debilis]|uniref:aminodeoxychorismate synthase n=1 Tax=Protomyces lactucae-debilis TaxID=2754530 RepID=A0A1Y2F241_PROLT|nr:ADC synthase [Protomyces lactucae-debilis]ORY77767.1 ADC synthase [Protomyces lactucae-debilis]